MCLLYGPNSGGSRISQKYRTHPLGEVPITQITIFFYKNSLRERLLLDPPFLNVNSKKRKTGEHDEIPFIYAIFILVTIYAWLPWLHVFVTI